MAASETATAPAPGSAPTSPTGGDVIAAELAAPASIETAPTDPDVGGVVPPEPVPPVSAPPSVARGEAVPETFAIREPGGQGLRVFANLRRLLVDGFSSLLEVRFEMDGTESADHLEVSIQHPTALRYPVSEKIAALPAGEAQEILLELDLSERSAGAKSLRVEIACQSGGMRRRWRSDLPVVILKEPSSNQFSLDLSNIGNQTLSGGGANAGLASENKAQIKIGELIDLSKVRTINDLLATELADNFIPLKLKLESEEPLGLWIPPNFLGRPVPPSRKLVLHLGGEDQAYAEITADRIYRMGRHSVQSDLVAWFLPRDANNDERTRGLSKEHARLESRLGAVFLEDAGSTNGTAWNGLTMLESSRKLTENGEIGLASGTGSLFRIDAMFFDPISATFPEAVNMSRMVVSPVDDAAGPAGCAVLVPRDKKGVVTRLLWLPGQAAVGSQSGLPLFLDDPALAPVQAVLHHYRQGIWIQNLVPNQAVAVDGVLLRAGEIAPLLDGGSLRLGRFQFSLAAS